MTPQIDDGPRMPFGRYGREPSGEPGKLSSPALMQSECIAGDAGIPRTDPQPERIKGHTRRLARAIAHPSSAGVSAASSKQTALASFPPDGENCVSLRCFSSPYRKRFAGLRFGRGTAKRAHQFSLRRLY